MKNKYFLTTLLVGSLALSMNFTSLAGQWQQDSKGWWYQEDGGSYPSNTWKEIEGKQYYFNQDGYLVEENKNSNYFVRETKVVTTDASVIYSLNSGLYVANLDGSGAKKINSSTPYFVVGVDNKIYYTLAGVLYRINMDGSSLETLHVTPEPDYRFSVSFANNTGIATTRGFYDISSNQFIDGRKESLSISDLLNKPATSSLQSAIPNKNYRYTKVTSCNGDYVIVYTYNDDSSKSILNPYSLTGEYIINTKTNKCVASLQGEDLSESEEIVISSVDENGLLIRKFKELYRVENFSLVKVADINQQATHYTVKNGLLYYIENDKKIVISTIGTAALPK